MYWDGYTERPTTGVCLFLHDVMKVDISSFDLLPMFIKPPSGITNSFYGIKEKWKSGNMITYINITT